MAQQPRFLQAHKLTTIGYSPEAKWCISSQNKLREKIEQVALQHELRGANFRFIGKFLESGKDGSQAENIKA